MNPPNLEHSKFEQCVNYVDRPAENEAHTRTHKFKKHGANQHWELSKTVPGDSVCKSGCIPDVTYIFAMNLQK